MPVTQPQLVEIPRGAVLGKYEIARKLATGGMAEIYLARVRGTAGFEKLVVLKRILPNVAQDPTFVEMFLDEARLAATLQHPNIADVYDVGELDGSYFFTMEFIHGQDARAVKGTARKRGEPVPLNIAIAIVHGTASALDYAHTKLAPDGTPRGVVHRDVSTSNILISYDGAVKLVDFGIARATGRQTKTLTGMLKGKIPYMSPEQYTGSPIDRRSDLFSLGVVMFELTVGKRPFRGDTDFAVMEQIVRGSPPRPSELVPGYPLELERIVLKLLARDLGDRYQSGEDLLADLEAFAAANQLWLSPKSLSRYMRTLFADKIEAWEKAEREGVPLAQHVPEVITAQSQRGELLTPPSAFPAAMATELAPHPGMYPAPAPTLVAPLIPAAPAYAPAAPAYAPATSGSRRVIVIALATTLTLAGIGLVIATRRGDRPAAPVAAPKTEVLPSAAPVRAPAPPPPPVATEPTPPPVAEPPPPPPVAPTSAVALPADAGATAAITDRAPKPVIKPKRKSAQPEAKDQTWDPDSPLLPPKP